MEYIKKDNNRFHALSGDNITINGINIFDSRVNHKGASGNAVKVIVNKFTLAWYSNFSYGSWEFGEVHLIYEGIIIKYIRNIDTTQKFVDLLNKYINYTQSDLEDLILGLANAVQAFRHATNKVYISTQFNEANKDLATKFNLNIISRNDKDKVKYINQILEENELIKTRLEEVNSKILNFKLITDSFISEMTELSDKRKSKLKN